MVDSVLTTLGAGSGIDTRRLVADLTAAARSPRSRAIDSRDAVNIARLSAIAQLSNGVATIADSARGRLRTLADADIPTFVEDLVSALSEVRTQLNAATRATATTPAPLSADNGARALSRLLGAFAGGTVAGSTLRAIDIGISTARDGTLALDGDKFARAFAADPVGVKALLGVGTAVPSGLGATLQTLRTATVAALVPSKAIYSRATTAITRDRERLETDMTTMTDRLTSGFTAMDRQVAAIKASQAYLTQQVAIWTAQR